jgi:hypothetical protein
VVEESTFAVQCLTPTEKIAFDARALQTELMITALSCGRNNDYILVDTTAFLTHAVIHPVDIQDRDRGLLVLATLIACHGPFT